MNRYTVYLPSGASACFCAERRDRIEDHHSVVYQFTIQGAVVAEFFMTDIAGYTVEPEALDGASLRDPQYFAECMVKALQAGNPALDQELRWRVSPLAPFEEKA